MKRLLLFLMAYIPFVAVAQFEAGEYLNADTAKITGESIIYPFSDTTGQFHYSKMRDPSEDLDGVNLRTLFQRIANLDSLGLLVSDIVSGTEIINSGETQIYFPSAFDSNNVSVVPFVRRGSDDAVIDFLINDVDSLGFDIVVWDDNVKLNYIASQKISHSSDIFGEPIYSADSLWIKSAIRALLSDSAFIKSGVRDWNSSLAKTIDATDTTWWGRAETDPFYVADSAGLKTNIRNLANDTANYVTYAGNTQDLDLGANSVSADSGYFDVIQKRNRTDVNFVFEGDSRMDGSVGIGWTDLIKYKSNFQNKGVFYNVSTGGDVIADVVGDYASQVYPLRPDGSTIKESYLFLLIGINDLSATTPNYQTLAASLLGYCNTATADGFKVVVITPFYRQTSTPVQELARLKYIDSLCMSTSSYHMIIDTESLFPPSTQNVLYADIVHLNAYGNNLLANLVNDKINNLPKNNIVNRFSKYDVITPYTKLQIDGALYVNRDYGLYFSYNGASRASIRSNSLNDIYLNTAAKAGALVAYNTNGFIGVSCYFPDKQLEVNSSTGANIRMTYNDNDGAATNYVDLGVSSTGNMTITPSGGDVSITGNLSVSKKITAQDSLCLGAFRFIVRLDTLCSVVGTDTLRIHPKR